MRYPHLAKISAIANNNRKRKNFFQLMRVVFLKKLNPIEKEIMQIPEVKSEFDKYINNEKIPIITSKGFSLSIYVSTQNDITNIKGAYIDTELDVIFNMKKWFTINKLPCFIDLTVFYRLPEDDKQTLWDIGVARKVKEERVVVQCELPDKEPSSSLPNDGLPF